MMVGGGGPAVDGVGPCCVYGLKVCADSVL